MEGLRKLKQTAQEFREDFMKILNNCTLRKTNSARTKGFKSSNISKAILACLLVAFQLLAIFVPVGGAVEAEDGGVSLVIGDMPDVLPKGEVFEVDVTIHNNSGSKITYAELNISQIDGLAPVNSDCRILAVLEI